MPRFDFNRALGDAGDYFYIVETGSFEVFIGKNKVRDITSGGSFGEHALLYDAPRGATIKAGTNGTLFALDRQTFKSTLSSNMDSKTQQISEALRSVPLLAKLTDSEITRLTDSVVVLNFKKGNRRYQIT